MLVKNHKGVGSKYYTQLTEWGLMLLNRAQKGTNTLKDTPSVP
jgi:hypothetical protein